MDDRSNQNHSIASVHRANAGFKYPAPAKKQWKLKTFGKALMVLGATSLMMEANEGYAIGYQLMIWGTGAFVAYIGYKLHRLGGGASFRDMIE